MEETQDIQTVVNNAPISTTDKEALTEFFKNKEVSRTYTRNEEITDKDKKMLELITKTELTKEDEQFLENSIINNQEPESDAVSNIALNKAFSEYYNKNYKSKMFSLAVVDGNDKILFKLNNFDAIVNTEICKYREISELIAKFKNKG